jgi:ATP-dependent Lon protease
MQESMYVAKTVAWNLLPKSTKKSLRKTWGSEGESGIHIHCPEGATPKDGPSAGGAITTALLSLLSNIPIKNDIAMTGEIDLNGYIHAIGGLEEKLEGAKRAGVKLALCPEENLSDLNKIKRKNSRLFDGNFEVKTIKNIKEIINLTFTKKLAVDESILSFR